MNVIPGENAWRQRPFVSAIYAAQEANCIKIRRDSVTDIMRDRELQLSENSESTFCAGAKK